MAKNTTSAATSAPVKLVKSLVPVEYDGVRHEPGGEAFEVRESDLPQLLEVNAVELVEEQTAAA